jgi:hypothetical protein
VVPEFPIDTALFGVVGAIIAVAVKIFLGKKTNEPVKTEAPDPPVDKGVHEAASKVVVQNFEDGVDKIEDANTEEVEEDRLKRLSELANLAKRR